MAGCRDHSLSGQNILTSLTVATLCQTIGSASGCQSCHGHFLVSRCRDHFLCHQDCGAGSAVLTFRQAVLCTSSVNRLVNSLAMAGCRNDFLCSQDYGTCRAVLAFCQTGLRASGSNSTVDHFTVTGGGNNLLRNQDHRTGSAVLAFCQTVFGTSGGHGAVNDLGVTGGRDHFRFKQNCVTDTAILFLCLAAGCAGRFHCLYSHLRVSLGRDDLSGHKDKGTNTAILIACSAGLCASGRNGLTELAGVAQRGNHSLFRKHYGTNGTFFACGQTAFSTGGGGARNGYIGMSALGHGFRLVLSAVDAGIEHFALFQTGRHLGISAIVVNMVIPRAVGIDDLILRFRGLGKVGSVIRVDVEIVVIYPEPVDGIAGSQCRLIDDLCSIALWEIFINRIGRREEQTLPIGTEAVKDPLPAVPIAGDGIQLLGVPIVPAT